MKHSERNNYNYYPKTEPLDIYKPMFIISLNAFYVQFPHRLSSENIIQESYCLPYKRVLRFLNVSFYVPPAILPVITYNRTYSMDINEPKKACVVFTSLAVLPTHILSWQLIADIIWLKLNMFCYGFG